MSNQKEPISKHCILLLNFGEHEAEVLRKAGFNVEVGYFADRVSDDSGKKSLPYYFPRPVYEYEVLVYNSKAPDEKSVSGLFPRIGNLLADQKMMAPLLVWNTLPDVRIAFTGYAGAKSLFPAGLGFLELTEAHAGVSIFEIAEPGQTFAIRELAKVIASFRSKIAEPVRQYSHWAERQRQWPFSHFPVIVNRNGDQIASYGTTYDSRTIPRYVVLPQLNNNSTALAELLGLIARLHPELFPDRELREWYTADEFAFQEEKNIDQELEEKIQDIRALIARRQQEKVEVAERYGFIKKILVAKEDPAVETDDRLSTNVRKVLEFLGFQVEDIDAKIRGVIRKEDFWVRDGDFLAITEVTGTAGKNPKIKEYNDLLGRMTTIFKRRDLVPDVSDITGLLVINHDIDTHPRKRPQLYAGAMEEIVDAAKEQNIGLLSTIALYDITLAAKDGVITKEEARGMIKQFGRIEFAPPQKEGVPGG